MPLRASKCLAGSCWRHVHWLIKAPGYRQALANDGGELSKYAASSVGSADLVSRSSNLGAQGTAFVVS